MIHLPLRVSERWRGFQLKPTQWPDRCGDRSVKCDKILIKPLYIYFSCLLFNNKDWHTDTVTSIGTPRPLRTVSIQTPRVDHPGSEWLCSDSRFCWRPPRWSCVTWRPGPSCLAPSSPSCLSSRSRWQHSPSVPPVLGLCSSERSGWVGPVCTIAWGTKMAGLWEDCPGYCVPPPQC